MRNRATMNTAAPIAMNYVIIVFYQQDCAYYDKHCHKYSQGCNIKWRFYTRCRNAVTHRFCYRYCDSQGQYTLGHLGRVNM